jgi:hypothetical protein
MKEKILSLDVSTKTGWGFIVSDGKTFDLQAWGQIPQIHQPDGVYPVNFVEWSRACFEKIEELIELYQPDVLVIEETSAGSKAIYTQKILEYIHFNIAWYISKYPIKVVYFLTEQWRRDTGCKMTKEESKHNKDVSKYKQKNETKIAYNEAGKRVGRLTRKHINIRRANELFADFLPEPLRKKDEDLADALLLGFAYHLRKHAQER